MATISLTCPTCRATFTNIKIEDGEVRCPNCGAIVFQYRFAGDEKLTPGDFTEMLNSERGREAVHKSKLWFKGHMRLPAAGAFVAYIWPHLAKTFEVKQE